MRDTQDHVWADNATAAPVGGPKARIVEDLTYDEKDFFESFYRSHVRGDPEDRMTIGQITDWESRYHYNCVENAIISAMARRQPPPPSMMVETWRRLHLRRGYRLLDIGSGTGHWIDFFRQVFFVTEAVGVEITESMSAYLRAKYAGQAVSIRNVDIARDDLAMATIGDNFDFVTAIGVMFHLVDDDRLRTALSNLASLLGDDGLLFITGDFGAETRNVQFHKHDHFEHWDAKEQLDPSNSMIRVNKRVRSLAEWHVMATTAGLTIVDLVRTPREPNLATPENDLLVFSR